MMAFEIEGIYSLNRADTFRLELTSYLQTRAVALSPDILELECTVNVWSLMVLSVWVRLPGS